MEAKTITIICDVLGCGRSYPSGTDHPNLAAGLAREDGWQVDQYGNDHCPDHITLDFECGTCGKGFPNVEQFDQHRRRRECGR